jgi:hypothetical protein
MSKSFQTVPPCSSNKTQNANSSGEYKVKTRLVVLILVLLVTTNSIPSVRGVPDDQYSPNSQNSVLVNLREAAEARRDELLYLFEEELPVEILRQLQNAIDHMGDASDLEISDPSAASKAYLETLRMFRVAWAMYSDYKPEAGEESLEEIIETFTPEPKPQDIEVKIKKTKEKRIEKFQEKILKKIEEEAPEESGSSSIFDAVKAGFQNLNKMIRQGTLTSAVDLLKITMTQYEAGVNEIESKQASKLDKTVTRLEDKLEREEEKESKNNGKSQAESNDDEKSNNGNSDIKSNNGNGNSKSEDEEPATNEKSNNGNDKSEDDEPEVEEKTNNGNGNSKEEPEDDDPVVEEKSNNGNDKPEEDEPEPKEKTNNGNGNSKEESDDDPEEESPKNDKEKPNNGKKKN